MPLIGLIKTLLPAVNSIIYDNASSSNTKATAITLCNTSDQPQKIYLSFSTSLAEWKKGCILSGLVLEANETIALPDKIIRQVDCVFGYAENADVIALSMDIQL